MIQVYPDSEALSRAAAELFVTRAQEAAARQGRFSVALSGGQTPRRAYELLAAPPLRDQMPWGQVHVFWGDERCIPPDHADSNYRMAREALLDRVPIPPEGVHCMQAEREDRDAAAEDYQDRKSVV